MAIGRMRTVLTVHAAAVMSDVVQMLTIVCSRTPLCTVRPLFTLSREWSQFGKYLGYINGAALREGRPQACAVRVARKWVAVRASPYVAAAHRMELRRDLICTGAD